MTVSEMGQRGTSFGRIPSMSVVNSVVLWPPSFSSELMQTVKMAF